MHRYSVSYRSLQLGSKTKPGVHQSHVAIMNLEPGTRSAKKLEWKTVKHSNKSG